jgi:hypothetical protein
MEGALSVPEYLPDGRPFEIRDHSMNLDTLVTTQKSLMALM